MKPATTDQELFEANAAIARQEPNTTLAFRISREHLIWIADTMDDLECELKTTQTALHAEKAAMLAVVKTAGGEIEGRPTGSHNILQRIRHLREVEKLWIDELNRQCSGQSDA